MGLGNQSSEQAERIMKPEYVFFLLFFVLACILYSDALRSYFNSDDFLDIYEGKIHPLSDFYRHFTYTRQGTYRPFVMFLYSIEYNLYGFHPFGYHITDLLFYWLAVVSIYYLALLLNPNRSFAFLAGLLFLLHPIHNEAIAWIASDFYQISGLFYVLALIFFIKHTNASPNWRIHYGLSLMFFASSLFSLESAITLPLILIVYTLLYKRTEWEKAARATTAIKLMPYFLLAGVFPVIRAYAIGDTYYSYSFNLKHVIRTVFCFICGLFAPSNALLKYLRAFEPGTLPAHTSVTQFYIWGALTCAIMAAVILGLAIIHKDFLKEYKTFLLFALVWIAITLMPYYLIAYRERFLFLPSIVFSMVLALAVNYLLPRYKAVKVKYYTLCLLTLVLLINWVFLTKSKVMVWRQAGDIAKGVIEAVHKEYKSFPPNSALFFIDLPGYIEPMRVPTLNTSLREALSLTYQDDTITVITVTNNEEYQTMLDHIQNTDPGTVFVFLYKDKKLVNVSDKFRTERPAQVSKNL